MAAATAFLHLISGQQTQELLLSFDQSVQEMYFKKKKKASECLHTS